MEELRLGAIEARFADIVWANAPLTTRELVNLCEKELNWARTTTYTVLKKLCDRGLFAMSDRRVTVVMTKKEYQSIRSEQFVENTFSGSLPAFIAAFAASKPLTAKDMDEIKTLLATLEEAAK